MPSRAFCGGMRREMREGNDGAGYETREGNVSDDDWEQVPRVVREAIEIVVQGFNVDRIGEEFVRVRSPAPKQSQAQVVVQRAKHAAMPTAKHIRACHAAGSSRIRSLAAMKLSKAITAPPFVQRR